MSTSADALSKRPFRLWDANEKKHLPWKCYKIKRNAHINAMIECRYAKVGVTIEVYNIDTGRLLGQYTRRANTVSFTGRGE